MDDDEDKVVEKYGYWAQSMTESEAKSMLDDYGNAMQGMKYVLEDAFGEGHSYSLDDVNGDGGPGQITFSGDLDGIASFRATLRSDSTDMIITFYYELPKLDCEASEIDDEIQTLEENYFGYESELETEVDSDDEYASINCSWSISCEPLFGDVPRMDEIIGFDDQVKEIINSHKK